MQRNVLEDKKQLATEYAELAWKSYGKRDLARIIELAIIADRAARHDGLADALRPFEEFADGRAFDAMPDHMPITAGSSMARRQLKAGDLRRLLASHDQGKSVDAPKQEEGDRPNYRDDARPCERCDDGRPIAQVTRLNGTEAASCFGCGHTGPFSNNMAGAVFAWNSEQSIIAATPSKRRAAMTDHTMLIERARRQASKEDPLTCELILSLADAIESLEADVHNARLAALENKRLAEADRDALEASQAEADARPCMCKSYDDRQKRSVLVELPEHMEAERARRIRDLGGPIVAIDACIIGEIRDVWAAGITTTGCCCGHNQPGIFPFIGVVDEDIPRMKAMGYEVQPNHLDLTREDSFKPKSIIPIAADARVQKAVERCAQIVDDKAHDAQREADDFRLSEVAVERSDIVLSLRAAAAAIRSQAGEQE